MWRGPELEIDKLQNLMTEFEESGYSFVLFTVNSNKADYIPKAAFLLDKTKMTMMLAMRPHLMSPQLHAMIFAGFNQVDKNRIMINWVNGHDKAASDKVIGLPKDFNDNDVRDQFSEEFFSKLSSVSVDGYKGLPLQVMPINRESTIDIAQKYGIFPIMHYGEFIERYSEVSKLNFERIFLEVSVVILDASQDKDAETKRILEQITNRYTQSSTIIGYESDIVDELNKLKSMGVTDVLIGSLTYEKENRKIVHDLVKRLTA
jgi:alkanesulfonate monooxygenase SsuD/methylene tetrahydromethanopterin reductase-like flavin-dependent oxidoreductase (luciferase family)